MMAGESGNWGEPKFIPRGIHGFPVIALLTYVLIFLIVLDLLPSKNLVVVIHIVLLNLHKKPFEFVTKIGLFCQDTHHQNRYLLT